MNGDTKSDNTGVSVTLGALQWAEVCSSLQSYIKSDGMRAYPNSRRDAIVCLQEIDRVMRGADDVAPPDDVMGPGCR